MIVVFIFNLLAYAWIYSVLRIISPNEVELWESLVTIALYIPLLAIIYAFDKIKGSKVAEI